MEFDDVENKLIVSSRIQFIEPILTVSSAKLLLKYFKQSLNLWLLWENSFDCKIIKKTIQIDNKIYGFVLFMKFLSKIIRNIIK